MIVIEDEDITEELVVVGLNNKHDHGNWDRSSLKRGKKIKA
jgi:hypothetical protein